MEGHLSFPRLKALSYENLILEVSEYVKVNATLGLGTGAVFVGKDISDLLGDNGINHVVINFSLAFQDCDLREGLTNLLKGFHEHHCAGNKRRTRRDVQGKYRDFGLLSRRQQE